MPGRFRCVFDECDELSLSLRGLVSHMRENHSLSKNLQFECPLRNCVVQIRSSESFRKHVSYKHRTEFDSDRSLIVEVQKQNVNILGDSGIDGDEVQVQDTPNLVSSGYVYNKLLHDVQKDAKRLRLHLEHTFSIPSGISSSVYSECVQFSLGMQRKFSELFSLRLSELNVHDKELNLYLESPELDELCKETKGSNLSALHDLGYIEPEEIDLYDLSGMDPPGNIVKRPVMHYVSILKTLQSYLSHEDVMSSILRETFASSEHLLNFTSGSVFHSHPLFSVDRHSLRLHLYMDELELCNPLGGNTKKHKICCIYFQVANIGQKNLSSLQSIHLVSLVRWPYVLKFGYTTILKPLVNDLKVLAEGGIDVAVKSGGRAHFRGAVAVFVGDNLSIHALGGYRKCFSSGKVCRTCLADFSELKELREESQCNMRSPDLHAWHMEVVKKDNSLAGVYGVSDLSALASFPFFENPYCLPPDIMHDLLEKMLPLNVKCVLRGLHKQKVLPYVTAQAIHSKFKFRGINNVNRHPGLPDNLCSGKVHVKGSASQKLHLFHFLSLILGPEVPADNKFWKLHLLLNRIMDIVMAVRISADMVIELKILVTEHHDLWVKVVSGSYPPKLHYLMHYARYILMHGPLRHLWCMRFEAFHQIVKRMSNKSRNFINVTKTLSCKVQMKKCLELSGLCGLAPSIQIKSSQRDVCVTSLPTEVNGYASKFNLSGPLVEVTAVKLDGLLIKHKCYHILDVHDGDPVFLLVENIYCHSYTVLVYGPVVPSRGFNEHLHAFEIGMPSDRICVDGAQLCPGQTLQSYLIGGISYIKMRFTPLK